MIPLAEMSRLAGGYFRAFIYIGYYTVARRYGFYVRVALYGRFECS